MTHLLCIGIPDAPVFLPMYLLFGAKAFKVSWFVAYLVFIIAHQAAYSGYLAPPEGVDDTFVENFKDKSDRVLLTFLAAVAIAFQQFCILAMLWPVSTLGFRERFWRVLFGVDVCAWVMLFSVFFDMVMARFLL